MVVLYSLERWNRAAHALHTPSSAAFPFQGPKIGQNTFPAEYKLNRSSGTHQVPRAFAGPLRRHNLLRARPGTPRWARTDRKTSGRLQYLLLRSTTKLRWERECLLLFQLRSGQDLRKAYTTSLQVHLNKLRKSRVLLSLSSVSDFTASAQQVVRDKLHLLLLSKNGRK